MKSFLGALKILGIHIIMCIVPFILMPILMSDSKYTINTPKSAGQIIGYAIYLLLFLAIYFLAGRKSFKEVNIKNTVAVSVVSLMISGYAVFMYFYVIVAQRVELSLLSIPAMAQLVVKRALTDSVVGNKIVGTIVMMLPLIVILAGYFSNGKKVKVEE